MPKLSVVEIKTTLMQFLLVTVTSSL